MAYNEKLTRRVRGALAHLQNVEEKKMFRGVAFMVNGKLCISAGDDELMFRIDPAVHDAIIKSSGVRAVIMKGKPYKGYVYVNEDIVKTKSKLDYWINLALDFNKFAKSSRKK